MLQSYRKYGAFFWHDWNIQNWGTKWNAYEAVRKTETSVQFDTAWKAPHPVISLLAAKFPGAEIEHLWADEDIGNNYGHRTYQNGSVTEHEIKDPVDFALTVREDDREYYRVNPTTGLWEYHDAEETETVSG